MQERASTIVARASRLLLGLATVCGGCGPNHPARSNLVLVTLDTTRADVVAAALRDGELMPNLARLGEHAVGFPHAYTTAPLTLPAHASILTGLVPPRHGLRDNGLAALPDEARTLAEVLGEHDYATAAFVSSVVLDRAFGLDQGFEVYDQPALEKRVEGQGVVERSSAATAAAARDWLEQRAGDERPFFLWVHFYDPHVPYHPAPEFLARAGGDAYLGEVAAVDDALGLLLATLQDLDLDGTTLLALTADHGESLGEHGEPTHGALCYEAAVRVPFLLCFPGTPPMPGPAHLVSVVDLYPTLLGRLGLPVPDGLDGLDLFDPGLPTGRGVYFESYSGYFYYGWSPLAGWTDGHGKYLHSSEPELYWPLQDPHELDDLARQRPGDCSAAREHIQELLARPALVPQAARDDAELTAALAALGYGGGTATEDLPGPLDPVDRPSPGSRAEELAPLLRAHTLFEAGDLGPARRLAEELVRENPGHLLALDILALSLMELGEFEPAEAALRQRLAHGPARADTYLNLGYCLLERGQRVEARAAFTSAAELEPGRAEVAEAFERLRAR